MYNFQNIFCIKAIYMNHPSILAIGEIYNKNRRLPFSLSKTQRDEILGDILKLETSKAC